MRMRLAVVTCNAYLDAVSPFLSLLSKFWPDHPPVWLVTDEIPPKAIEQRCHGGVFVYPGKSPSSWCVRLAAFANLCNAPVMIAQEDFWLNAPVHTDLIDHALEQMHNRNAGVVRLYPCPGANEDYGDAQVGLVKPHTDYRASLQLSVWQPRYLHAIATQCQTPSDFEIGGSRYASTYLKEDVLAWKRDATPYPVSYLVSAIGRGLYSQDAKRLCDREGIEMDVSRRGFQPA